MNALHYSKNLFYLSELAALAIVYTKSEPKEQLLRRTAIDALSKMLDWCLEVGHGTRYSNQEWKAYKQLLHCCVRVLVQFGDEGRKVLDEKNLDHDKNNKNAGISSKIHHAMSRELQVVTYPLYITGSAGNKKQVTYHPHEIGHYPIKTDVSIDIAAYHDDLFKMWAKILENWGTFICQGDPAPLPSAA